MLLKQKDSSSFFDFYRKNTPDNKTKFKQFLKKGLTVFMGLQVLMLGFNAFRIENFKDEIEVKSINMYNDYSAYMKAVVAGDQDKAITLFGKVKSYDNSVADLLLSGNILMINGLQDPDTPVEYKYKLTPETIKTINYIYNSNLNSGVEKQKQVINSTKCLYLDVACHIAMPYLKEEVLEGVDIVASKVEKNNYNIAHMPEYHQWQKDVALALKKGDQAAISAAIAKNPGQLHIDAQ